MKKVILILLPILAILIAILVKANWDFLMSISYQCAFHKYTGLWCPGCGNTRFVREMLRGNVLVALRCNLGTAFGILVAVLGYTENVLNCFFNCNKKLLPRNEKFWAVAMVVLIAYYVARNFVPILDIPI